MSSEVGLGDVIDESLAKPFQVCDEHFVHVDGLF